MKNCKKGLFYVGLWFLGACSVSLPETVEVAFNNLPEEVDFNYHIKPILSDRCYQCHGPDENTRKANLRLDIEEEAFKKLKSGNGHLFLVMLENRRVFIAF